MRKLPTSARPLLPQTGAYVAAFLAVRGGGSFMRLLAMPMFAASLPLLGQGICAVRRELR